ncbi:MAG: DUF5050 domain-containing protein [Oscillospiraceae bacterium]
MKKMMTILSAAVLFILICGCPLSASAASDVPVLKVSNVDSTSNRLKWTKVDGAKSYIIFLRNEESGKYVKKAEVKGTSCRSKNLEPNTKYTYRIAPKFSDGKIGKPSAAVSVYTCNYVGRQPNSSFAAEQGEWIYFSSGYCGYYDEVGVKYTLSKIKKDGTGLAKINDDYAEYINVIGNDIYYLNCESGELKKVNGISGEEQVLFEEDDNWITDLIAAGDMLYYVTGHSDHEEVRNDYKLYAMSTDGTEARYIMTFGNAYNSYSAKYIGIRDNNICFGYKVVNEVWDESEFDGEPINIRMEDTGEYRIVGINEYDTTDMYSFEISDSSCSEIRNGIFYYSNEDMIGHFDLENPDNRQETELSAISYMEVNGGIVYTSLNSDKNREFDICIGDEKKVYFPEGFADYSLFDDFAVFLTNDGDIKIINYYEQG